MFQRVVEIGRYHHPSFHLRPFQKYRVSNTSGGCYVRTLSELPCQRPDKEGSYRMFEENMDEYLDEEIESLRNALELICRGWDKKVSGFVSNPPDGPRPMFP